MNAPDSADTILGQADNFLAALERVSRVAPLAKPVLIIGERGSGKELIAARLHYLSERWAKPFVKFNCAALNEELLESELFGHVAGAYTGAARARIGRFELASGGTIFIDELASMSTRLQEKLLRVVEYGEFERVGSSETLKVDVRFVGAANVDLPAQARAGKFREDLLDRLSFDVITVPPLRERQEDIVLLAQKFAEGMARELDREYFAGFSPAAGRALQAYSWPGNVRELRNVVERAVYRLDHARQVIERVDFDPFASPYRPQARADMATPSAGTTAVSAVAAPALATPSAKFAEPTLPLNLEKHRRRIRDQPAQSCLERGTLQPEARRRAAGAELSPVPWSAAQIQAVAEQSGGVMRMLIWSSK